MTPQDLIAAFDTVAEAPDGVKRLRELVLQLAVRGKLVAQDAGDEPASALLKTLSEHQRSLIRTKSLRKQQSPEPLPDVPPFEVPETWTWARLVEAIWIESNLVEPDGYPSHPHIAPNHIEKGTGRLLPYATVREDGVTSSKHLFFPGQIIYSKIRPNLSKAVIVDFEGLCSADMYPLTTTMDTRYVLTFILSRPFIQQVVEEDNRLAMPKVNQEQLSQVLVAIPPLAEQHRIVTRVDELMDLLDRLEAARTARDTTRAASRDAALAALREADSPEEVEVAWNRFAERMDDLLCDPADIDPLRQAVLQLAVRGKLVPQDPGDEPAGVLLERIAAEKDRLVKEKAFSGTTRKDEPYQLPHGWCWSRFGSLLFEGPSNGWSPKGVEVDTGVRTLKLSATTRGVFDGSYFKFVDAELDEESPLWLRPGDLLIQRSNTPQYVGMAAVYYGEANKFIYPDLMMRCRVWPGLSVGFIHLALIAPFNREWFAENASGTSASMVKVNQGTVRSTLIPVPPLPEQHRIVARVDELMGILDRLEARLTAAQTTHAAFASAAVHHLDA